ncbi:MAG: hypothetical protein CL624_09270 [Arcobacter sp.]|nr:hypothetical protein [Arcobacter sp.]
MKPKILLLDDEIEVLSLFIEFLNEHYEVDVCNSVNTFFEMIEDKVYDVFLLDINMPLMNGLEVCKKIKENQKYIYTPVLFITAFSDISKIEQGFLVGAVDYITKPLRLQEVKIRIDSHYKMSKSRMELKDEHLELNRQIEELTKELKNTKDEIVEEDFQDRESRFKSTNRQIEENKVKNEIFNEKFRDIQEKLEKQKKLLQDTKISLNLM